MNALDKKLNDYFTGYVVRKDLVKQVSSNAAVPGIAASRDSPDTSQIGTASGSIPAAPKVSR